MQYQVQGGILHRKTYLGPLLRCLDEEEARYMVREIHWGICGIHLDLRMIVGKLMNAGYFWLGMHQSVIEEIKSCEECQRHASTTLWAKNNLIPVTSAWPFQKWGIDIVGPFPNDNGKQFADNPFKKWCEDLHIKQVLASVAHPQANGRVKRANISIVACIKTRLGKQGLACVNELPHVLWAYRTTQKSGQRESLFSLTYGTEVVIPAEVGMLTVRIREQFDNDEELRLNLDLIEKRKETIAVRELNYKREMEKYYNKKVREVRFKKGKYVMRNNEASSVEAQDKLGPRWEGPYIVFEATDKGAYKLQKLDRTPVPRMWNDIHLKKCYM
ncbi:uncharacterized protein LOC143622119 [Bidens hawaiensis]|uniref:uncharacterized protein LOC143622119 n=1 Tax=Bidens hawaiensis TaxID=980011 RepID=UPI0040496F58